MSSSATHLPPILTHVVERERALKEHVLLLTVVTETIPQVPVERWIRVNSLGGGLYQAIATYGFMQEPDVPAIVCEVVLRLGLRCDLDDTTYYLGREAVLATSKGAMGEFAEGLFGYLQRNAVTADRHFKIPPGQVIEIGIQVDL